MRSTEADQSVVVMTLVNPSRAKGLNRSAEDMRQPVMGGANV